MELNFYMPEDKQLFGKNINVSDKLQTELDKVAKNYDAMKKAISKESGKENDTQYIVENADIKCRKSVALKQLQVPNWHPIKVTGKGKINENDCLVDFNIPPFDICDIDKKPCTPNIVDKWLNTKSDEVDAGNIPLVTKNSFLVCSKGGLIEPVTTGQGMVSPQSMQQIEQDILKVLVNNKEEIDRGMKFAGTYENYLAKLAYGESQGLYNMFNTTRRDVFGKYQFAAVVLEDLKLTAPGTEGKVWLENRWNVHNQEEFLANKNNCQEELKRLLDKSIWNKLKKDNKLGVIGKTYKGDPKYGENDVVVTPSGLLAMIALTGPSANFDPIDSQARRHYLRYFSNYDISILEKEGFADYDAKTPYYSDED